MKLRYIFGIVLSAILLASCSDEDSKAGSLDGIKLDQTFLSIDEKGGTATVSINTNDSWAFEEIFTLKSKDANGNSITTNHPLPAWLTASAVSGPAGQTIVTFSAEATSGGREAELHIKMGNNIQYLIVRQGSLEASDATCADVIAGADGKTFRVKGVCTGIYNTTYGNWYLDDGTGQITIYGTLDKEGKTKNFTSLGLEVGDIVTVEGPKTTYGTTVELVDVTVIKIEKSLIKVVTEPAEVGKEGKDIEVKVAYKGNGAFANIQDGAQEWVKYVDMKHIPGVATVRDTNPADTAVFKFQIAPNPGEGRKASIEFKSYNGKNSSSVTYTISQEANVLPHGQNPEDPFSVAEAIAKCKAIGNTSDGVIYYAKGIISSISSIDTGSYGNATFNISDDGNDENAIVCYRSFFLDNAKFTSEDQIKVGDEVVITGKLVNYKDKAGKETPEFSGNVYVYSYKKASNDPGTKNNPFTIAQAIAYIDGGGKDNVYVKGVVSELVSGGFGAQYGNGSFYISDDGKNYGDATKDFEAYQVNWLGNQKWTEGTPQIAVGDVVILYGPLTKYKTTYETQGKSAAYIYTLNGKTK